jgi:hypothetical protein
LHFTFSAFPIASLEQQSSELWSLHGVDRKKATSDLELASLHYEQLGRTV